LTHVFHLLEKLQEKKKNFDCICLLNASALVREVARKRQRWEAVITLFHCPFLFFSWFFCAAVLL
jgi:hypothetical protein